MLKFKARKSSSLQGFTLAEVLVTLGIIGVVASLTMPTLMANNKRKVTTERLKKFYNVMSQAVEKWKNDNNLLPEDIHFDNLNRNSTNYETWWKNSIGKEIKTVSEEKISSVFYKVILADGSGFSAYVNGTVMHFFYCVEAKFCEQKEDWGNPSYDGKNTFLFSLQNGKFVTSSNEYHNYTREQLLQSCKTGAIKSDGSSTGQARHACTRLIEMDGWEIKDDYPWNAVTLEKKK